MGGVGWCVILLFGIIRFLIKKIVTTKEKPGVANNKTNKMSKTIESNKVSQLYLAFFAQICPILLDDIVDQLIFSPLALLYYIVKLFPV